VGVRRGPGARRAGRGPGGWGGSANPRLLLVAAGALHQRYFRDRPQDAAVREFDAGQAALREPGQGAARAHFREAVRLDPRHAPAHFNLALLLAPTDSEGSIREYRAAVAADPGFVPARVNLANALARQGLYAEAIEQYRQALKLAPDDPLARENLARALAAQERASR
jgi:tetratricopeptide (TPR) repeat protein